MIFKDPNPLAPTSYRKYYRKMHEPIYFLPPLIAPDEIFIMMNSNNVPGLFDYRYIISNYGRVYDILKNEFIVVRYSKLYYSVGLATVDQDNKVQMKSFWLHRLVMQSFNIVPNYMELEVNHLNGDHSDNRLCNLEWCTPRENMDYAVKHRQMPHSENAPNATLTNTQAEEVCKMLEAGMKMVDISNQLGINYDRIKDIKRGVGYRYISENYNIPETMDRRDRLPDEVVLEIAHRLGNGEQMVDISKDMNINVSTIKSIKTRETYKDLTKDIYMGNVRKITKLNEEQVRRICEYLQMKLQYKDIIIRIKNEFGIDVSDKSIFDIKRRKSFTNITCEYDW